MDENESKSSADHTLQIHTAHSILNGKQNSEHKASHYLVLKENLPISSESEILTPVKSEPICVFVNRNFDSSDSEHPITIDEDMAKR